MFYIPVAGQLIEHARNYIAAKALTQGADKLIFLDDDVSWNPEDLVKLAKMPHSIIGGTYRKKSPTEEKYAVALPDEMRYDRYGAIPVNYVPTGFMKIETSVLREMSEGLENYPHPAVLGTKEEDYMYPFFKVLTVAEEGHDAGESEDTYFCVEWQRIGGTCWILPELKPAHITEITLNNNFENYLKNITVPANNSENSNSSN